MRQVLTPPTDLQFSRRVQKPNPVEFYTPQTHSISINRANEKSEQGEKERVQKTMAKQSEWERTRMSARDRDSGFEKKNTLNSDMYNYFNNYNSKPETINSYFQKRAKTCNPTVICLEISLDFNAQILKLSAFGLVCQKKINQHTHTHTRSHARTETTLQTNANALYERIVRASAHPD